MPSYPGHATGELSDFINKVPICVIVASLRRKTNEEPGSELAKTSISKDNVGLE